MTLLWLVWACSSSPEVPPELRAMREAADAWERGRDALEAGRADDALGAFAVARAARPDDVLLWAWEARALSAVGRHQEAVARLDQVLARTPGFAEARYNRAAYRARAGELDAAAADLRDALRAGAATPRHALRDPDFAPHLVQEAFGFLPRSALAPRLEVPERPAFLGSEIELRLTVEGARSGPLEVDGAIEGPITLVRVVEDDVSRADGDRDRVLTWVITGTGAGAARIGPLTVAQGGVATEVAAAQVEILAPGGAAAPGTRCAVAVPSALTEGRAPPAAWGGASGWALVPPGSRVLTEPEVGLSAAWALRVDGVPTAELIGWSTPVSVVRVLDRGQEVFRGPPADGAVPTLCAPVTPP